MRVFIAVLVLIFSLQSFTKADDISEFEIEGMSIGDSALDYLSKSEIEKNKYYAEYTFYYWFWKNLLKEIPDGTWVGFCGYRYHWSNQNLIKSAELNKIVNKENFNTLILKQIPDEWSKHEIILGEELFIDNWKLSKIFKKGFHILLKNPLAFLKKNQNIKLVNLHLDQELKL